MLTICILHNFILQQNLDTKQFEANDGYSSKAPDSDTYNKNELNTQYMKWSSNSDLCILITNEMYYDFENHKLLNID